MKGVFPLDHSLFYYMASLFWDLVGKLLSFIAACPEDTPIPMEVENLCAICLQFYTGPYQYCAYCKKKEVTHHGDCCLEKPAFLRRRRTQPQPGWGRFPLFHPDVPPLPGPPTGQYEPRQSEPPVRSQGEGATTAVGDEPMVTWARYGLTAPLALWPPAMSQAREDSLASAQQHFVRTQIAPFHAIESAQRQRAVQPKTAQAKHNHWQTVANVPKSSGLPANRSVPASTAKARGLAAMSSQMQAFVPRNSMDEPVQNRAPEADSHNTVIERFDLAADDTSSMSSWSVAQ